MENLHLINFIGAIKTNPVFGLWLLFSVVGAWIYFFAMRRKQHKRLDLAYPWTLRKLVLFNLFAAVVVGGIMVKREMVEYSDMVKMANTTVEKKFCVSHRYVLECPDSDTVLTKLSDDQIREMYLRTR